MAYIWLDRASQLSFHTFGISGKASVINAGHDVNISHGNDVNDHGVWLLLRIHYPLIDTCEVCQWLAAPDVSVNYNAARKINHPQNGSWFVSGEIYKRWKKLPDFPLWLFGSREFICGFLLKIHSKRCVQLDVGKPSYGQSFLALLFAQQWLRSTMNFSARLS